MKTMIGMVLIGATLAMPASAQLLGGRAGVGASVGAPTGAVIDGATRTTGDLADAATATARSTPSVKVRAGVSTRVDRGTRCYYQPDDYYYDPVYRDGYYYCEQRSSGASAGAAVATPR